MWDPTNLPQALIAAYLNLPDWLKKQIIPILVY